MGGGVLVIMSRGMLVSLLDCTVNSINASVIHPEPPRTRGTSPASVADDGSG